eukprot:gnl/TRDRNA2_/TRDRNA2_182113_c0_seq1.p1 gnl/TRDRNA2_/TRDRNA2_182113_c0~~gnl/TRDRNA2_/TRDRNA2_182113_c0_seq1.p1  ORF type:complete len:671 (+),score=168.55 gnl/TRDRNA2_/TRDRNA2_182113_c0_seq1:93-2105(+)
MTTTVFKMIKLAAVVASLSMSCSAEEGIGGWKECHNSDETSLLQVNLQAVSSKEKKNDDDSQVAAEHKAAETQRDPSPKEKEAEGHAQKAEEEQRKAAKNESASEEAPQGALLQEETLEDLAQGETKRKKTGGRLAQGQGAKAKSHAKVAVIDDAQSKAAAMNKLTKIAAHSQKQAKLWKQIAAERANSLKHAKSAQKKWAMLAKQATKKAKKMAKKAKKLRAVAKGVEKKEQVWAKESETASDGEEEQTAARRGFDLFKLGALVSNQVSASSNRYGTTMRAAHQATAPSTTAAAAAAATSRVTATSGATEKLQANAPSRQALVGQRVIAPTSVQHGQAKVQASDTAATANSLAAAEENEAHSTAMANVEIIEKLSNKNHQSREFGWARNEASAHATAKLKAQRGTGRKRRAINFAASSNKAATANLAQKHQAQSNSMSNLKLLNELKNKNHQNSQNSEFGWARKGTAKVGAQSGAYGGNTGRATTLAATASSLATAKRDRRAMQEERHGHRSESKAMANAEVIQQLSNKNRKERDGALGHSQNQRAGTSLHDAAGSNAQVYQKNAAKVTRAGATAAAKNRASVATNAEEAALTRAGIKKQARVRSTFAKQAGAKRRMPRRMENAAEDDNAFANMENAAEESQDRQQRFQSMVDNIRAKHDQDHRRLMSQ